jgi:hypothetical protein
VGTLNNYGTVWYSKSVITNILSLLKVKHIFYITYNRKNGNQFVVMKPDTQIIFKESKRGLYYHDTANRAITMVNTVKENREGITDRAYKCSKQA